ncbi:hypothetical protein DAPPUDRAFT_253577 [Daphnia pulex]|uniref:Integrase catalytic domain-containing protein n=1 Tax=Daphnia pulex TaxID=6669 RepID=E9H549_DAPPU|nr:hypothetical protein DAPPUDRAFT_253577 [Daphnia pulex]|eukprot:EFX73068.1 hypothetical protein DAPPUDRAFT_253577 [Daphnia pulex]
MEDNVKEWETHHVFATAEHPQTSGLVDRVNRTMNQALEGYFNTDMMIGIAICRQQFLKSKQLDKLVYGRLPFTTLKNHFPCPKERPKPFDIFLARVGELREAARHNIIRKQEKSKRLVNQRRRIVRDLRPGELVLVRIKLKKKNKTKKYLPKYVGPFQVVKKICPTTYLVEDLPANRQK